MLNWINEFMAQQELKKKNVQLLKKRDIEKYLDDVTILKLKNGFLKQEIEQINCFQDNLLKKIEYLEKSSLRRIKNAK